MKFSFRQSGTVYCKNLFWLALMPLLGSLASCSPEEYATQQMDSFPMVSASLELAEQRITETTRLAKFNSNTEDLNALNLAISNHDKDGINRVLAKYGAFASRHYRPANLATLVAANDTLPGPSIAKRSSPSHLGFLYGAQLIGKGSGGTGSTTRMNYLEPFGYLTYSLAW
ncbi:hypothetical protein GO755_38555 [Spirosoma sp. HMF4905]|uniref:TolC family protein n=1 Tax=Spirosoma arboris TaxID=2682092 RepID=A0A7K1SQA7_9BACT|nr:hypothetical protein [Spirosoma arboris]MVM35979.1 hypothetical protein [Spirosoma arboris]